MTLEDAVMYIERNDIIPQCEKDELRSAYNNTKIKSDNLMELIEVSRKMVNALTARGLFYEPIFSRFAGEFRVFELVLIGLEKEYGYGKKKQCAVVR